MNGGKYTQTDAEGIEYSETKKELSSFNQEASQYYFIQLR